MATEKRQFTLRMQESTYEKVRYLAFVDRRSIAMEIEHIINKYANEYEKENGPIPVENSFEDS